MNKKRSIILQSACAVLIVQSVSVFCATQAQIAKALHWHVDKTNQHNGCNLCDGYYAQPKSILEIQHPPPAQTSKINISAQGPVVFHPDGTSTLQKKVVITQPGRIIHADKAIVIRDAKLGKITDIHLVGHVSAEMFGKRMVGQSAEYNVVNDTFTINGAIYHISGKHFGPTTQTNFNAWGTAKTIRHYPKNVTILKHATYSTCAPIDPAWVMSADSLKLDRDKGEGTAINMLLRFKHIPIFWMPYFYFSTSSARKSGFLTPSFGYSNDHGFSFHEPFYWNIAPNYDLLLTPQWYSKRDVMLSGLFRYLTSRSSGHLYASIIPSDSVFQTFKSKTLESFEGKTIPTDLQPYLSDMRNMSDDRGYVDFEHQTVFSQSWQLALALHYASDPYFLRDFAADGMSDNTNQLPSFARLNYYGMHWNGDFFLQTYQTLHSLDHYDSPTQNQYSRLPELDLDGRYPEFFHHLNLDMNAQYVHFNYFSSYYPYTYQRPIGDRLHIQASVNRRFNWLSGYITPQVTIDNTGYFTKLDTTDSSTQRPSFDKTRVLPIFNIDSGLYFDRRIHFHHVGYIQTLEPRVFYLYTPYLNQDEFPNFDTQSLPFSPSNLFSLNQFAGFDRIQNANQLSVGVISRILSESSDSTLLTAQLGFINYFQDPRVCLLSGCSVNHRSVSPITGSLSFTPSSSWSLSGDIAWDSVLRQINNGSVSAQYHFDAKHTAVLGYQFVHGNPDTPFDNLGFSTNTNLLTVGLRWPLSNRISAFGYSYYDITHGHPESEFAGFSYDTCCWALRLVVQNNYDGTTQINGGSTFQNRYSTNYYLEFLLKGLGSAGNRSAGGLLSSSLPGTQDMFSNEGHYEYEDGI